MRGIVSTSWNCEEFGEKLREELRMGRSFLFLQSSIWDERAADLPVSCIVSFRPKPN
jgi:hypothetical protein